MKNHWLGKKEEKKVEEVCCQVIPSEKIVSPWADVPAEFKKYAYGSNGIIDNSSVKYERETELGPFTFKDAGELGVDIFFNDKRMGWLNSNGEQELLTWLLAKRQKLESVKSKERNYEKYFAVVSNEHVKILNDINQTFYVTGHAHIVPGSLIVSIYNNNEHLTTRCMPEDESVEFIGLSEFKVNHALGSININWAIVPDNAYMNLCYEYKVQA